MLKLENISTGYGKKQVLFDVSLEVEQGEIVLLAGSNGSGKSTLLKAIYAILPQWGKGSIIFEKEDITGYQTSSLLQKGLLYIPQKNNLFENLTVKENLEMAGLTLNNKLLKHRIEKALSIFTTLEVHLNSIPMKLSGGERQLLTLAMATLHQPKVMLIDEILNGLTSQNITVVVKILKELNQKKGITMLIAEHRIKECLQFANKVISMKYGIVQNILEVNENFDINELNLIFT